MHKQWGHAQFRPGQAEAIAAALEGRDALVVLPTGGGKSLCYQIPALLQEGLTLVISPLIALMQDQVAGLRARGVAAAFINSTLPPYEVDQRWTNAEHGQYSVLYVAPERLSSELFQARMERLNVSLLAVDEAHCVSEWGHHFRPEYQSIAGARDTMGAPPILAVTATATPPVRRDIIKLLDLEDPLQIVHGFDRPNLVWSIFREENKRKKVQDVLQQVPGSGLIYASTRKGVERWARRLEQWGESVAHYHGGLRGEERAQAQARWVDSAARVMVATNAFGMGIDKPDVRFVIHVDAPSSVEAYYQEAGRAGRDGERAYAVLLFHPSDLDTQHALIDASHPVAVEVQAVYDAVCNLGQVPVGSQPEAPLAVDLDAVARLTGYPQTKIRTAIELLSRQGAWQTLPQRRRYGLLRFDQTASQVRRYAASTSNAALADFVRTLMRTIHADAFTTWHRIDLRLLARRTELPKDRVRNGLDYLQHQKLLDWRPPGAATYLELAIPRSQKFPVDDRAVRKARKRAESRLNYMLRYARSVTCRRQFLLAYFGEAYTGQCGTCDVCLGRHRPPAITPDDEALLRRILQEAEAGAARADWFEDGAPAPAPRISRLLDWLVAEGYLTLADPLREAYALTEKGAHMVEA